jgi:hypothetical protein
MSGANIEWVEVTDYTGSKKVGAIGFSGDTAVAAVAYFDDADWNQDGQISSVERFFPRVPVAGKLFFRKGRAMADVLTRAMQEPDIVLRDPTIGTWRGSVLTELAAGLVMEGVYLVYLRRAVKQGAARAAQLATSGLVKQYVIRKGMEHVVKGAYEKSISTGVGF